MVVSLLLLVAALAAGCGGGLRSPATPGPGSAPPGGGSGGINRSEHVDKPYAILVSLDGFKPEYLDRFDLPHMRSLVADGARAAAMMPVFPSMTFPNHYSLVTGLHPGSHGIVNNAFFDPARGQSYSMRDAQAVTDGSWYRGEPIWATAERQGMVSASYFWVGSEAAIAGIRPTLAEKYAAGVPNDTRVARVLEWLQLPPERRPHLIALYFSDVDTASHAGPLEAAAVEEAARALDRAVGALMDGIRRLAIRDSIYVLLTSDHGMVETSPDRTVALESLIDATDVEHAFGGPVGNIYLRGGARRAAYVRNRLNERLTHGRAYLRQDVPERFRYRDPRVGDVVVIMDEGWMLVTSSERERSRSGPWGMHGWDNALPSMQATFVISGPGIRRGTTVGAVENVDVYPLLTELLGLAPAPRIDGRANRIRRMVMIGER